MENLGLIPPSPLLRYRYAEDKNLQAALPLAGGGEPCELYSVASDYLLSEVARQLVTFGYV